MPRGSVRHFHGIASLVLSNLESQKLMDGLQRSWVGSFNHDLAARVRPLIVVVNFLTLTDAARWTRVLCSRRFEWRSALVMVKPDTLIGWHGKAFKWFWRCQARSGRPPLQGEIREWIVRMAKENPTWGQRRVAAELYSSWAFWCPLEPCESTGPGDEMTALAKQLRPSAGRPSYATTPMRWSLVTSWLQSRLSSSCSTCLSSWSTGLGVFCNAT